MDEEVEDCIGDVKYIDSQNTIPTSPIYQKSCNNSNSDEQNSIGKETYVIECDSDESTAFEVHYSKTVLYTNPNCFKSLKHGKQAKSTMQGEIKQTSEYSVQAQETYTQTSKTLIELAKVEQEIAQINSLQTQTSKYLITENQSKEVKIEVHCPSATVASDFLGNFKFQRKETILPCVKINKYDPIAHKHAIEEILNIVDDFNDGSRDNSFGKTTSACNFSDQEMDDDSLCKNSDLVMRYTQGDSISENSEISKSARNDVEELYRQISEIDIFGVKRTDNTVKQFASLTPLTEESIRKDSVNNSYANSQKTHNLFLIDKSINDCLHQKDSNGGKINKREDNTCSSKNKLYTQTSVENSYTQGKDKSDNIKVANNSPMIVTALTFSKTNQHSAIITRDDLEGFSATDEVNDKHEGQGFGRHDKVLGQISSLFIKSQVGQPISNYQNIFQTKKCSPISVSGNNDIAFKNNYIEEIASQTSPTKLLDQVTQCENKIKPAFVNYEPSESSCGKDSHPRVIDADSIDINIKLLPDSAKDRNHNKLPQIERENNDKPYSCPNSSRVNVLLTVNASPKRPASKPEVFPHIRNNKIYRDGSIKSTKCLNKESSKGDQIHLPPVNRKITKSALGKPRNPMKLQNMTQSEVFQDMISIDGMIRELRTSQRPPSSSRSNRKSRSLSRGQSPSGASTIASEFSPSLERACDNMLTDILRRLRSFNWLEVVDTLNDIPRQMSKFWGATPESRVADFIRQVTALADSPRTQVARSACTALAVILKKTNYTKKPEFYEAVSSLLSKSGSYNRCVRRAANLALDDVISSSELTHAVTALTVHGADHKSPLVRSATARLLVVCVALASGGADLLKSKPPSIATARRQALKALSLLIEDKNTETRKFAERLYVMLRQLSNFEAFYLTDVDVDVASRQLKKYDRQLFQPHEDPLKRTR